jgi:hypothetical protein
MLSAIHLDDYFGRVANKIDDTRPYRCLPPKPNAVQSMSAKQAPNNPFGIARLRPQRASAATHFRRYAPRRSFGNSINHGHQ